MNHEKDSPHLEILLVKQENKNLRIEIGKLKAEIDYLTTFQKELNRMKNTSREENLIIKKDQRVIFLQEKNIELQAEIRRLRNDNVELIRKLAVNKITT